MRDCPVCRSDNITATVRRALLPIFQNVVWDTREEAIAAPSAPFTLGTCADCGFSYNAAFDASLVIYDERYDNNVPSAAFRAYYQSLIDMLADRFDLSTGAVYDVGCGKGEFLEMLCASAPGISGVGIDPSCSPTERGNFRLVQDFLKPEHFGPDAKLVVVRHVLEHIDQPADFMAMIRSCVPDGIPVFVEVPDLDWILANNAAWDFCYEHCNYFTLPSLATCLNIAGFDVIDQHRSFGDQYQWALALPGKASTPPRGMGLDAVAAAEAYAGRESAKVADLANLASDGGVAIWGMATKGVMMSAILGSDVILGGIDGNIRKQGKFAAGSGVSINPPDWVRELPHRTPTLLMNPNYAAEIGQTVRDLGADIRLVAV